MTQFISSHTLRRLCVSVSLLAMLGSTAKSDFWNPRGKAKPETINLIRKLPPIAVRTGKTVRFEPEVSGSSIPAEIATILKEKIRTLLLKSKSGEIQLVDGAADTSIKCILTGYEPKILHPETRKVGFENQSIVTWIGNIEASVQVFDAQGRPLDAANLKSHLENDFITAEKETQASSVTDKKKGWRGKLADAITTAKGGDNGDIAVLLGGGKEIHDVLSAEDKGAREPTELEWRDAVVEGLADKVANRIVEIDQAIVAILPIDKEFAQIRELAKASHWGEVQEQSEKMGQLTGTKEAFRLYTIGLSNEALACGQGDNPGQAAELLNKASKSYSDAANVLPSEREFRLAQIRVQDSLEHYLEIDHYRQTRKVSPEPAVQITRAPPADSVKTVAETSEVNNSALVEMAKSGMDPSIMLTFVQTAQNAKFDVSAAGLVQLAQARVPSTVIQAVQKKMTARTPRVPTKTSAIKQSTPVAQN